MRDKSNTTGDVRSTSTVAGASAVGAGFGAIAGAIVGWFLGAQVSAVPTVGPVVGQGVLTTTVVALLIGAAIGALGGALMAVVPGADADQRDEVTREQELYEDVPDDAVHTGTVPQPANLDAGENDGSLYAPEHSLVVQDDEIRVPFSRVPFREEVQDVNDNQQGHNPNNFTGTEDAIDPETGALGTAGTPVTTGYGVSGSTIGTGSRRGQADQESEDFRGSTPDSVPYDAGGRGTGDSGILEGAEREPAATEKHSDAGRVEGSVPRESGQRDVYEQSDGYGENLARDPGGAPVDFEVDPSLDSPPRSARVDPDGVRDSEGTDIAGTRDPRGLGDNSDDT